MIARLLGLIPGPYRWLALVLALAAAWGAWEWHGSRQFDRGVQHQKDKQAVIDGDRNRKAAAESERRRLQEERTRKAQQEAIHAAEQQAAQARADKIIAEAASGALQRRYEQRVRDLVRAVTAAASARGEGSGDPAAAGAGPAADDAAILLADVQRRIDARAGELAAYADTARTAGEACVIAYEALMP